MLAGALFLSFLTGCAVQSHLLNNAGELLSKETVTDDEDLELLQHASAYHLKVSQALLQEIPDHVKLAESVTRGYTQYAYVYLMDEADRTESEGIQKANQLRSRAAKMLLRAKSLGLQTLSRRYPLWDASAQDKKSSASIEIAPADVGLAYWTMTAWAGAISLSKDSPDIVADLPQVLKLAEATWIANPRFDKGGLASMMGTLELARPGGNLGRAQAYFDSAIEWRLDQISPFVAKAENWAVAANNKDAFIQLLTQAIELGKDKSDLSNVIMVRRARWLLESSDNLF